MKKVLGFIFGIALCQTGLTQIVIDGAEFISPGTTLIYENANPAWNLGQDLININGENAEWNIADWQMLGNTIESYGSLDTLPFINQLVFHNQLLCPASYSTVVLPVGQGIVDLPLPVEISDGYSYFRKDSTGYYNTGTSFVISGFPLTTPNDTVERIYKFPMHYGDTDMSTLAYFISLPTLGAYGQHGTRVSEVDGSGILNTPYGSYNVLRVRAVINTTDTLYIDQFGLGQTIVRPEQIDYAWISPNVAGPVLKMSVINGVVISTQLLNDSGISGISENRVGEFQVYPNPATTFISIKTDTPTLSYRIYDSTGSVVLSQKKVDSLIDVEDLTPGIYFLQLQFSDQSTAIQKLVITE